jgi:hypothetical protein
LSLSKRLSPWSEKSAGTETLDDEFPPKRLPYASIRHGFEVWRGRQARLAVKVDLQRLRLVIEATTGDFHLAFVEAIGGEAECQFHDFSR